MLKKITGFIIRYRWFVILFWVLLAAAIYLLTPNLTDVANSDQTSFLPADSSAVKANRLVQELFPDKGGRSSLVLILNREDGISGEDIAYAGKLEQYLKQNKSAFSIQEIVSPFSDGINSVNGVNGASSGLEDQMISEDNSVALINISLTAPAYTDTVNKAVDQVKGIVKTGSFTLDGKEYSPPEGLGIYLTGDATMSAEEHESINKSMDLTVKITIALILVILVAIYRTPVAPILPLFTIGLSFAISRGIIAYLTNFGFKVSSFTETFLIAVLFGAGTDYCLLIISRFKEELSRGANVKQANVKQATVKEALVSSIPNTGAAVISSGGTVIVGFLFMIFAQFGLFSTTGPSVAIGVAVTILAVLTLTPALLSIIGHKIFWPSKKLLALKGDVRHSFWGRLSDSVTRKPVRFILITLAAFIPFIVLSTTIQLSYDQLKEMPSYTDSVKGYELLKQNFAQGEILPVKIVIKIGQSDQEGKSDKSMWDADSLKTVDELADNLLKLDGVAKVRTATRPLGDKLTGASLSEQIGMLSDGLVDIGKAFDPITAGLESMQDGLEKIATGISQGANGMTEMSGATRQASDGIFRTGVGLDSIADGTGNSVAGLNTIKAGIEQLKGGVDQANQGVSQTGLTVSGSIKSLEKAMHSSVEIVSNKDIQTVYYTLGAVLESLDSINLALSGISAGLNDSSIGIAQTGDGLADIKGGIASSEAALNRIRSGLDTMRKAQEQAGNDLKTASEGLAKIGAGIAPSIDALGRVKSGIGEIADSTGNYAQNKETGDTGDTRAAEDTEDAGDVLGSVFFLPPEAIQQHPELKAAMENYISPDGKGIVLDAILSISPYTNEALDLIERFKDTVGFTLKGSPLEGSEFQIGGATSAFSDVRQMTSRDLTIVMIFVICGIFVVLVILLRSLIAPIYLILTILISYASTMGISNLVFRYILGYDGLHWAVPFFAFCVLVALGIDYNIFLMSRVKEEYRPGDMTGSMARALTNTGGIITSCGIIMAGTFGALLASPVRPMLEVGFAAFVGLLIDTFIIRCLMVPAIAVKVGELNWWPGRRIKILPANEDISAHR